MSTINGGNHADLLVGTGNADTIHGGNGTDLILGGGGADQLFGDNGNDIVSGGSGNDSLEGGNGTDLLSGDEGDDDLDGGNGADILVGGAGDDSLDGGASLDTAIYTGRQSDYVFVQLADGAIRVSDTRATSSDGTDVVSNVELFVFRDRIALSAALPFAAALTANDQGGFDIGLSDASVLDESLGTTGVDNVTYGGTETVTLPDNVENVTLTGTADTDANGNDGDNTVVGNAGSNTLSAGAGNDVVDGGDGNDTLVGGSGEGDDTYIGGDGVDTVVYSSATQGITVDLAAGTASGPEIGNDTLSGVENVIGGSGDDVILGDGQANELSGGDGNDLLGGGPGNDLLDGGNGLDRASYLQATAGITVALAAGTVTVGASTDTLASIEFVRGGDFADTFDATGFDGSSPNAGSNGTFNEFEGRGDNDTITGNGNTRVSYVNATAGVNVSLGTGSATGDASVGTDTILGGVNAARGSQFNDELRGTAGNDTLEGLDGDDFLGGGAGDDTLNGGPGFDTAAYGLAGGAVTVDLVAGTATGAGGNDTLIGVDGVIGSAFNDVLRGHGNANTLNGNDGNDFLVGRGGNDILDGGNGIDVARFLGARSAYTFAPGTVTGPDGTDATNSVELLQFDDAYMLGFALTPINLTGFTGLAAGVSLFGRGVSDQLTMGTNASGRLIDLGGDNDTLTLGVPGPGSQTYSLNLANIETLNGSTADETVNMSSTITNNMLVNLDGGNDRLNLGNGNDTVTVQNVETVFGFGGTDTVTFVHNDPFTGQSFDLGLGGTDTLILTGTNSNFGLTIGGDLTVVGATASGNEDVSLLNVQGGSTFDLGAGTDALHLFNNGVNVNVVTLRNVENVFAVGFDSDQITIAGNAGGITTVMAGGGADLLWASADEDHFSYAVTGDSLYDVPFGGLRDTITGFDASEDRFVFDGPGFTGPVTWELINFGGQDIVRIDVNGDAVGEAGWDMAIGLNGLVGTLTNANFIVV